MSNYTVNNLLSCFISIHKKLAGLSNEFEAAKTEDVLKEAKNRKIELKKNERTAGISC